jgi:hypothetical protein
MSVTRLSGGLTPASGADPRTFPTIFNEAADEIEAQADQIAAQATAIAAQGTAIAAKVDVAGDTMTGGLTVPNVALGVSVAGSDTVALDFSTSDGFVSRQVGGTAVVVTASGYSEGVTKTVRFLGGTALASLDVPADWTFVGAPVADSLGTAVVAVLTATSFGTAASDVVAAFAEEA